MRWRRQRKQRDETIHRGRVYRSGTWWRYKCGSCNYGAGTNVPLHGAFPWLIRLATTHADPNHWTRGGS